MRELFLSDYLPIMARVADLKWLEAELRQGEWRWPGQVSNWPEGALAMVIADQRDDSEIDKLELAATARIPGHDLGPWLASRMLRGDMTGQPEAGLPEPA
jgi:hypothetical protein